MAKKIDTQPKLISEYLKLEKSTKFVIPKYQREYSWNISKCDELWQDIVDFIDSDTTDPYFFGTIIISCEKEDTEFHLIDGQQRTTTFLLLLKALLIRLNKSIEKIPKDDEDLEGLRSALEEYRKKIMAILYQAKAEEIPAMLKDFSKVKNISILKNESINELPEYKDEVKKIIEAENYKTAENDVYKDNNKRKDNRYTNHFRNFKYFYEKIKDKDVTELKQFAEIFLEKCQIIEIRSWQEEQAIKMFNSLNSKGMLLSDANIILAKLYYNAGDKKDDFNKLWIEIVNLTKELETQKIVDVNIDAILTHFMYINRATEKEYLKNEGSVEVTVPGVRRYYTELHKELLNNPSELCGELLKITKKWEKIKDYPIVKLLAKFNANAKLYLAGYLYRFNVEDIDEKNVLNICECLLKLFTILELVDTGYSSAKFKTFLFRENLKLVDENIPDKEIEKDFIDHIRNKWDKKEEIKEAIFEYDGNILVYLNEYLYMKEKGNSNEYNFTESVNIEHIMPSSGKNISQVRKDAGITDEDEFNNIVNQLGNKILLEEKINKSIGNEWFRTKIQSSIKSGKTGYIDSKYAIAKSLTEYQKTTWEKDDIETATGKVVERIMKFIYSESDNITF